MSDRATRKDELLADLGFKRLNLVSAKLEVLFGLTAAGVGLLVGNWAVAEHDWPIAAAALALFVLGGYLAMAGHRSHLYQSSNQLTAHLVDEIRHRKDKGSPA
jgi:hypothetical protein